MIYFTADTHFFHKSVIKLCDRPFDDVDGMNKKLIGNWNSLVQPSDEVYILGDFAYKGTPEQVNEILEKLSGKKYLIRGNHDKFLDKDEFDKSAFEWIEDYHVLKYQKKEFVLFHFPILEWHGFYRDSIHLYGHVHNCSSTEQAEKLYSLGKRAINVGSDVHGFFPVSIDRIIGLVDVDC